MGGISASTLRDIRRTMTYGHLLRLDYVLASRFLYLYCSGPDKKGLA